MQFKYLMMAAVALAGSVVSLAPPPTTTPAKTEATLQKCETVIAEIKQPVVKSCDDGKVDDVKDHLMKAQQPVQSLSTTITASATITIQKEVIKRYCDEFVKVLIKFQAVLTVVSKYSKIKSGCTEVYKKFDVHFDKICAHFKKHGVEVYKQIYATTTLELTVWESSGFTFYKKGGYIGH